MEILYKFKWKICWWCVCVFFSSIRKSLNCNLPSSLRIIVWSANERTSDQTARACNFNFTESWNVSFAGSGTFRLPVNYMLEKFMRKKNNKNKKKLWSILWLPPSNFDTCSNKTTKRMNEWQKNIYICKTKVKSNSAWRAH